MSEILIRPVMQLTCPECQAVLRLVGTAPVRCCGYAYQIEIQIMQRRAADVDAFQAEFAAALARGNSGERIAVPAWPPYQLYPVRSY